MIGSMVIEAEFARADCQAADSKRNFGRTGAIGGDDTAQRIVRDIDNGHGAGNMG